MKRINLTALLALIAFPLAIAQAGDNYGISCKQPIGCKEPICDQTAYIFGYGGLLFGYENDVNAGGRSFDFDFEEGFIVGAGAGIYSDLLCGSRFEIEGLYAANDLDSISPANVIAANGDAETYAVMVNALKEIPLGCITGYAGAGIGYAWTDLSVAGASDSDGALAYQLIIGGDLPITDCIALFAQYKLLGISDTDYNFGGVAASVDSYFTHSFSVGARLSF